MSKPRPIHPEAIPGEPLAVRWVVNTSPLSVGEVRKAPGTFGPMLEYGVIERALVEGDGVWTWLAPEQSWAEHGPRIRDALSSALDLEGWEVEGGSADLLRLVATDVVGNQLAGYIRSHGGQITVVANDAESVDLDFGGACEDCPASGQTLHQRIETAIRARYPKFKTVRRIGKGNRPAWLNMPGQNC